MTTLPTPEPSPPTLTTDPADVVVQFLRGAGGVRRRQCTRPRGRGSRLHQCVAAHHRGHARLERIARPWLRPGRMGFNVHFNHVATEDAVVLTDGLTRSTSGASPRVRVYGRFVVGPDGKITLWRDSFDWLDVTIGNLRGLAGLLSPSLNRQMPAD